MKTYKLKRGNEKLNSSAGNLLIGRILTGSEARDHLPNFQRRRADAFTDYEILMSMVGLLCNGRSDYCDIKLFSEGELFCHAYGLGCVPSESVLHNRLDELPERSHAYLFYVP